VTFYFDVIEVYKGPVESGTRARIINRPDEASCGVGGYGGIGTEWLVYVTGNPSDGFHDHLCSRSRAGRRARRDMRRLDWTLRDEAEPPAVKARGCAVVSGPDRIPHWMIFSSLILAASGWRRDPTWQ
jgi:hypothetical protein